MSARVHQPSAVPYEAPALVRLGTLAELTQGQYGGFDDAVIGADGGFGSVAIP